MSREKGVLHFLTPVVKDPRVSITCNGGERNARAEAIEEVARKRALLWRDPFLRPAPLRDSTSACVDAGRDQPWRPSR